jgi:hypothetical protein
MAGRPAPLRLTRRGRVVVLTFLILLAMLASAVLLTTASRASDPVDGPMPTVVVQPYDTLWSVAERAAPHRGTRDVVAEIRWLNGLGDYTIHPGERLVVPR